MTSSSKIMAVLTLLIFAVPVQAEFYKYRDDAGVLRYTQDFSRVSPEQYQIVEEFEEIRSPVCKSADRHNSEVNDAEAVVHGKNQSKESRDQAQLKKINEVKHQLDSEYAGLVKEKEILAKIKKDIKTQDELQAYNEKIVDLNDRISQYETKRQLFAKEAETFNNNAGP